MSEIELLRHELESTRGELLALQEALEKATSDREQYRALYMQLLERCRLLERGIIAGQKAERFQGGDEAQLSMRLLEMLLKPDEAEADANDDDEESLEEALTEALQGEGDDDDPKPAEKGAPRRPRRGRRKLPQSLPRVEIEVLPPEVLQEGLENFRRIGEVVSETVERRPGSLVVARIVRPKFARKDAPEAETIDAQLADETPDGARTNTLITVTHNVTLASARRAQNAGGSSFSGSPSVPSAVSLLRSLKNHVRRPSGCTSRSR